MWSNWTWGNEGLDKTPRRYKPLRSNSKRDELGDRLAQRQLVQQIGVNPFNPHQNYVQDLAIQDRFLKPINTTQGNKVGY